MGKITFILGGARSGKSGYALKLAKESSKKVAFIATCKPDDPEMEKRVILHKNNRPKYWKTFEEPENSALTLKKIGNRFDCILVDCLTLLISNLMLKNLKEKAIKTAVNTLLDTAKKVKARVFIVSNEVGLSIVPENKLAREFRDISGRVNQVTAKKADEVFFLVAGIPCKIKG